MARVFPTAAARADLVGIREFSIHRFGPEVADDYFLGFHEAFDLLSQHPFVGAAVPEIGDGIRCLLHRKHRILYQVDGDIVLIVRIVHHAMDTRQAMRNAPK